MSPATGPIDTTVTITGTDFCGGADGSACANAGTQVEFLTPQATMVPIETISDTTITAVVPVIVPVGPAQIIVTFDGETSNEQNFTVTQE